MRALRRLVNSRASRGTGKLTDSHSDAEPRHHPGHRLTVAATCLRHPALVTLALHALVTVVVLGSIPLQPPFLYADVLGVGVRHITDFAMWLAYGEMPGPFADSVLALAYGLIAAQLCLVVIYATASQACCVIRLLALVLSVLIVWLLFRLVYEDDQRGLLLGLLCAPAVVLLALLGILRRLGYRLVDRANLPTTALGSHSLFQLMGFVTAVCILVATRPARFDDSSDSTVAVIVSWSIFAALSMLCALWSVLGVNRVWISCPLALTTLVGFIVGSHTWDQSNDDLGSLLMLLIGWQFLFAQGTLLIFRCAGWRFTSAEAIDTEAESARASCLVRRRSRVASSDVRLTL